MGNYFCKYTTFCLTLIILYFINNISYFPTMFIPFENLSPQARLWTYQANRSFSETELVIITETLHNFVQHWETHQQPLQASFQILHNRFIVLAVEENYQAASGCSIDKSVEIMKQLSVKLQVDLFDRLSINYQENLKDNSNEKLPTTWQSAQMTSLKAKITAKELTEDTIIFNALVQTKQELVENAFVKASQTWIKRYF
jgi:hypothetical protein